MNDKKINNKRVEMSDLASTVQSNKRNLTIIFSLSILIIMIFTLLYLIVKAIIYSTKYADTSPHVAQEKIAEVAEEELYYAEAYYTNRGVEYYQKGQYDQSISDFNKAIEINPGYAKAYSDRAVTYYQKGQYDKAISDLSNAIEINIRYDKAYYNRGIVYGKGKSQYDQAISDFNKAIEINPMYAEAYTNRGNAYVVKGQYDQAISDYNNALAP